LRILKGELSVILIFLTLVENPGGGAGKRENKERSGKR
jgi:hypothetical protein